MERPLVNILQNGEIKVKHQIWAVFYLVYRMYKKKTDFGQLIINLSNETGNPL